MLSTNIKSVQLIFFVLRYCVFRGRYFQTFLINNLLQRWVLILLIFNAISTQFCTAILKRSAGSLLYYILNSWSPGESLFSIATTKLLECIRKDIFWEINKCKYILQKNHTYIKYVTNI